MSSLDQIQNHFCVEETAFGSLDHELGESGFRWICVLLDHNRSDVGLDGEAAADPGHEVVRHVLVQAFVNISFVQTEIIVLGKHRLNSDLCCVM